MKQLDIITDFITGQDIPNIGAEMNRQDVEHFLVEKKGFDKNDISIDQEISFTIAGEVYHSKVDIIVSIESKKIMVIRCAAGSLGSRERETLAMARLVDEYQVPFSVVSDGKNAIVLDTISGKKNGEGLAAIPSKKEGLNQLKNIQLTDLSAKRKEQEKLIFRSYDSMIINVADNSRI
jgi:hypothetical protein